MPNYSEKLRDPRWQRLRLEVMQRDGFRCQSCGDASSTLHVHHKMYARPAWEPWEYPPLLLVTLCEDCHKAEPERHRDAMLIVVMLLGACGIHSARDLEHLGDAARQSWSAKTFADGTPREPSQTDEACAKGLSEVVRGFPLWKNDCGEDWFD